MFLLDTTIVSDLVNRGSNRHNAAVAFIESNRLFEDQIFVSTITLGELRFGREIRPLQSAVQLLFCKSFQAIPLG